MGQFKKTKRGIGRRSLIPLCEVDPSPWHLSRYHRFALHCPPPYFDQQEGLIEIMAGAKTHAADGEPHAGPTGDTHTHIKDPGPHRHANVNDCTKELCARCDCVRNLQSSLSAHAALCG